MKREIIIEIERVTIISKNSPETSDTSKNPETEDFIEVTAKEIKPIENLGLPPKKNERTKNK
jgi:hypothetical protein